MSTHRRADAAAPEAPFFSVLMATRNHARFVGEALDSVAGQSCGDYEIVVVNDGSTDGTEEVVRRWTDAFQRERSNRVVLSSTPGQGQSAALEHGFGLCRGRYVALLDSDDRWLPDKLARVRSAAEANPGAGMIGHPVRIMDAWGRPTGEVRPRRARLSSGDLREQIRRTGRSVSPVTSGVVLKASVFRSLLPMPTKRFPADADAYLTLAAGLAAPVAVLEEALAEYRVHRDGAYAAAMLSPEGLQVWLDEHRTIARHLGLEHVLERNSWFARTRFAVEKFSGSTRAQGTAYARLVRATVVDPAFSPADKAALLGFWSACLVSPRPAFARLWRWFQERHTGMSRMSPAAPPTEAALSALPQ